MRRDRTEIRCAWAAFIKIKPPRSTGFLLFMKCIMKAFWLACALMAFAVASVNVEDVTGIADSVVEDLGNAELVESLFPDHDVSGGAAGVVPHLWRFWPCLRLIMHSSWFSEPLI